MYTNTAPRTHSDTASSSPTFRKNLLPPSLRLRCCLRYSFVEGVGRVRTSRKSEESHFRKYLCCNFTRLLLADVFSGASTTCRKVSSPDVSIAYRSSERKTVCIASSFREHARRKSRKPQHKLLSVSALSHSATVIASFLSVITVEILKRGNDWGTNQPPPPHVHGLRLIWAAQVREGHVMKLPRWSRL
jgi:hypothetical protein